MATLTGFTRPSDPMSVSQIEAGITAAIGTPVTVEVTPTDVAVTGSITDSNRAAIQAALNSYYYQNTQAGVLVSDNPDMSARRHNMAISEYAVGTKDEAIYNATRRKNYVSGVLKNDSFLYTSKATSVSGSVTFYITDTGNSSGNPVFANVYNDSVAVIVYGASGNYQTSNPVVSADKKSVTVALSQISTVLGLLTFNGTAAGGLDFRLYVMGD